MHAASRADEVHYLASRQFLQQARAQRCNLYCPTLVLPECAAAIARPTADATLAEELVSLVENFPRLQLVPLDVPLARRAVHVAQCRSPGIIVSEVLTRARLGWLLARFVGPVAVSISVVGFVVYRIFLEQSGDAAYAQLALTYMLAISGLVVVILVRLVARPLVRA